MNLLKCFPVLVVMRSFSVVVINLHEAVLDEHLLDNLINVYKQDNATAVRDNIVLAPAPVEAAAQHKPSPAK